MSETVAWSILMALLAGWVVKSFYTDVIRKVWRRG